MALEELENLRGFFFHVCLLSLHDYQSQLRQWLSRGNCSSDTRNHFSEILVTAVTGKGILKILKIYRHEKKKYSDTRSIKIRVDALNDHSCVYCELFLSCWNIIKCFISCASAPQKKNSGGRGLKSNIRTKKGASGGLSKPFEDPLIANRWHYCTPLASFAVLTQ